MAKKGFIVEQFLGLVSKTTATLASLLTANGQVAYDSTLDKAIIRSNGVNDPVVLEARAATITNKTIDADANTITNIENADIKAGAAIDATKIANGSISNTEFQYLNGLTGNIQSQIDAIDSDAVQTLTNKTIDGDDNTLLDISLTSLKTVLADAGNFIVRNGSGVPVSNTKAVPSGVVVGTSDSQTLTNKTLTAPVINSGDIDGQTASNSSRITIPKANKAALDALTRKEATIVYADDQNTLYLDDGSTLSPIGGNFVSYATENISSNGTISLSLVVGLQLRRIQGNGGAVQANLIAFGSSAPANGTVVRLIGQSSTNTVQLVYSTGAKSLALNGNCILGQGSVLTLQYDATLDVWLEVSRENCF